jgi:hypothetical protein
LGGRIISGLAAWNSVDKDGYPVKSLLVGLLHDIRQIKRELVEILQLQQQAKEGFETMATKAEEIKAKLSEIGDDITEIDGDLQKLIDKINATPGDGLTGPETEEVLALLGDLKTRTSETAGKVPEPPTP